MGHVCSTHEKVDFYVCVPREGLVVTYVNITKLLHVCVCVCVGGGGGGGGGINYACHSSSTHLRLRSAGYPLLFCSNETQVTRKALVEKLQRLGFDLKEEEVHSPMPACRQFLQENNLRPYLIGRGSRVL